MTDSTATALLDAAEAEFAARGIEEGSLRAIMRAAGSDPGSVHYHFKSREALAEQVLDRILTPLNNRRLDLLAEKSMATPGLIPLTALLDALVRPDIEASVDLDERGQGRARLIGAIYIRPAMFVKSLVESRFGPVAQQFMPHLTLAVPHVPADTMAWRIRWVVFGMVGALLSDDEATPDDKEGLIRQIVATAGGALAAPIPKEAAS